VYVHSDVEIRGDLSIGGDTTIAGVMFSDDYTRITDNLTTNKDIDVRGNIFDGADTVVDVLDSLSLSGSLTFKNDLSIGQ